MLGLYVHVPFCTAICNYCNFNRGLFDESLKASFVDALIQEIRNSAGVAVRSDTLYFGGGTPSLLCAEDVSRVVVAAREWWHLSADAEVTLEANPESVDESRLDAFRRAGVNRLSFGVQSFRDEELHRLNRLHTAERAGQVIQMARRAGFDNVSLDLMMWLPQQTTEEWMTSVHRAIGCDPDHLSLYMLEVYPHLPLREDMDRRNWHQSPDDIVADMYEQAMAGLEAAGYAQYEISNVAKPGRSSRHNLKYWSDGEWMGFGPGAHSTRDGSRWRNVSATADYVSRMTRGDSIVGEHRVMTPEERIGDAMFTGLRLNEGVDVPALSQRYRTDIWQRFGERLAPYFEAGLLRKDGARVSLTRKGMLMAHEVMSVFV